MNKLIEANAEHIELAKKFVSWRFVFGQDAQNFTLAAKDIYAIYIIYLEDKGATYKVNRNDFRKILNDFGCYRLGRGRINGKLSDTIMMGPIFPRAPEDLTQDPFLQ